MQVKISDECVGCGICEAINSYVFLVDSIAKVNKNEINQNKQDLEQKRQDTQSLEYIEQIAREKLGMYLQNERVYVDSNM